MNGMATHPALVASVLGALGFGYALYAEYLRDSKGSDKLEEEGRKSDHVQPEQEDSCSHECPVITPVASRKRAKVGARKDYLQWDDYFMSVALLSAQRSKDPKTQAHARDSCKISLNPLKHTCNVRVTN